MLSAAWWVSEEKPERSSNKKKKVLNLGTRVSCSHEFNFCRGFLLKPTYKDKDHSRDELFIFQAFTDGWFSRYITFMTTNWSNVTHLETASLACSDEECDNALFWFFSLFFYFFPLPLYTQVSIELIMREMIAEKEFQMI